MVAFAQSFQKQNRTKQKQNLLSLYTLTSVARPGGSSNLTFTLGITLVTFLATNNYT